jgi:ribonuclease D
MTREEINMCPIRRYGGKICVINSTDQLLSVAEHINKEIILGFDTETRPAFKKGTTYSPALVQIAGRHVVWLFHLTHLGFPQILKDILSNPGITKAGVAVAQDIEKLGELGSFNSAGFVDLASVAKKSGLKNHGLRGLSAVLLGFRISKQVQVSNWAQRTLSPEQIRYAATDAWVSREIYYTLQGLNPAQIPG